MTRITVACLDMAGTTIADEGTVTEAFATAIAAQNLPAATYEQAMTAVRSSIGQSKIEVFRRILAFVILTDRLAVRKHGANTEGALTSVVGRSSSLT